MSDRAGTNPIPSHLKDRLTYIEVEPNLEAFLDHANDRQLDHRILGFLRNRPDFLSMFDPAADSSPSPRSWMRVDTMLKYKLPRVLENEAIRGQVGAAAQADFLGYLDIASEMPDPQDVLKGTHKDVPENPAVLYALCAALSAYATPKNSKHLMAYLNLTQTCLLYTSPSPRDRTRSRMPSSA